MSREKILEQAYKECPHKPGTGAWCKWISDRMDASDRIEETLDAIRRERKMLEDNHKLQLQRLNERAEAARNLCQHPAKTQILNVPEEGHCFCQCDICGREIGKDE